MAEPSRTMSQQLEASRPLLVIAIDFGTTYSGWTYSFKHDYESDPMKMYYKPWTGESCVSWKAPTAVLIKPDKETLHSFGYEAKTMYANLSLAGEDEHKKWYFFQHFKMILYDKMSFNRNVQLHDETEKSLPATTVFSLAIGYLNNHVLKECSKTLKTFNITDDEITWVLTVPAIWNDPAKQFMREAAVTAGIPKERLMIALEPETASICSCLLPIERMIDQKGMECFKPGSRYMVLDAGGGTIDITIHEVLPGAKLRELHTASGGAWGGLQVNEEYKKFIISLVGKPVFERFHSENIVLYLKMFWDFDLRKREIAPDSSTKVPLWFPYPLSLIFETLNGKGLNEAIKQTKYADKVDLMYETLRVDASIMQNFFSNTIKIIVSHVQELMQQERIQGLSNILMVGGFSESKMLQHAIRSHFPNVTVIIPQEASLVVLKGAVVFGHNPTSIAQRVCRYTYGVSKNVAFDSKKHDTRKRKEYEDGPYCTDIFDTFVEKDQRVDLLQETEKKMYLPMTEDQSSIGFTIYASIHKSPMYVTDEGCMKLGYIESDVLDKSVPMDERKVFFSMAFGGTEIEGTATEAKTGKCRKGTVDFLG